MGMKFYLGILCVFLIGCATTQGQTLNTQLQLRIGELERQLDIKNDEIVGLQQEIKDISYEVDQLKSKLNKQSQLSGFSGSQTSGKSGKKEGIIRVDVSTGQVQQALQNAGFYQGPIDGKIGARTKKAIEDFQRDKGLKIDGVVGKKTWEELQASTQ